MLPYVNINYSAGSTDHTDIRPRAITLHETLCADTNLSSGYAIPLTYDARLLMEYTKSPNAASTVFLLSVVLTVILLKGNCRNM